METGAKRRKKWKIPQLDSIGRSPYIGFIFKEALFPPYKLVDKFMVKLGGRYEKDKRGIPNLEWAVLMRRTWQKTGYNIELITDSPFPEIVEEKFAEIGYLCFNVTTCYDEDDITNLLDTRIETIYTDIPELVGGRIRPIEEANELYSGRDWM